MDAVEPLGTAAFSSQSNSSRAAISCSIPANASALNRQLYNPVLLVLM
jgi:hypothetical protein